jgi:hypothetical protein
MTASASTGLSTAPSNPAERTDNVPPTARLTPKTIGPMPAANKISAGTPNPIQMSISECQLTSLLLPD